MLTLRLRLTTSLLIASTLLLAACSSFRPDSPRMKQPADASLSTLKKLSNAKAKDQIGDLRMQALRDTALSVGARGGLAARSKILNMMLCKQEPLIDRVFDFRRLLLDKSVLPPVLVEGRETLDTGGPDVIRLSDRYYEILQQARFVTNPPNWREYLWMHYTQPETPDRSLLPRTNSEKTVWQAYITEGWKAGEQQAELIFAENLARLKRDYEGMLRYRTLLNQRMVSLPFVAETDLGVTGDSEHMTINDRILRITAFPELQLDPSQWKTEITPSEPCPTPP